MNRFFNQIILACALAGAAAAGFIIWQQHRKVAELEQQVLNYHAANGNLKTALLAERGARTRLENSLAAQKKGQKAAEQAAKTRQEAQNAATAPHQEWADSPVPDDIAGWVLDGSR